jgi:hypothetical protein
MLMRAVRGTSPLGGRPIDDWFVMPQMYSQNFEKSTEFWWIP